MIIFGKAICGALHDLIPFVQFKKRKKHPWRNINFSKVAGFKPATLLELTLLHGYFSRFLNFTNGTKSRNSSHILFYTMTSRETNLVLQLI